MTAALEFPFSLLDRATNGFFDLVGRVVAGGIPGNDASPLASTSGGGLWLAEFNKITLVTAADVKLWEAVAGLADSGATPFVVRDCVARTAPWPTIDGELVRSTDEILHGDGATHSDGTGYYQPVIGCWLANGAPLRATTVEIMMMQAGTVTGGEHFSIQHRTVGWRRYRVVGVQANGWQGEQHKVFSIRPPLREALDGSERVDWQRVRCVMRLATPDAMRLPLQLRRFGQPSLRFIESFDLES